MNKKKILYFLSLISFFLLVSCGFHLQGERHLAPPLRRLFLVTNDPYGQLARTLKEYLKVSHVVLVSSPSEANTLLRILSDDASQELLSVSGSQQTRQYNLRITVIFDIADANGKVLIGPQTLSETRTLTVQSNQVLGSSNEASLFYQQMRRTIAYGVLNRMASKEISHLIENALTVNKSKNV